MAGSNFGGKAGLELREVFARSDEAAGVELALVIKRDGHDGHVGCGLVAMDDRRQDVFFAVALFQPGQGISEVLILLLARHCVHFLGRSADEVFEAMNGVFADLLGGTLMPGLEDLSSGLPPCQDRVVDAFSGIGVRGVAFAEGVLEAGPHVAEGLDLGCAQDGEGFAAIKDHRAATTSPPAEGIELTHEVIGDTGHASPSQKQKARFMCTH